MPGAVGHVSKLPEHQHTVLPNALRDGGDASARKVHSPLDSGLYGGVPDEFLNFPWKAIELVPVMFVGLQSGCAGFALVRLVVKLAHWSGSLGLHLGI